MRSTIIPAAALLGAAAAAPWGNMNGWGQQDGGATATLHWSGSYPTGSASSSGQGQQPFKFPLSDSFPNPSADALKAIEMAAGGTLPNGALPTSISPTSAVLFSAIAFNEIFEVAFFTSLLTNITRNVPGFNIDSQILKDFVERELTAVIAQEELHALGANGILTTSGNQPITPCEYVFPSVDFDSAISTASTFTDVVLGTLQDVQVGLNADGDGAKFLALIGSVIAQEGEQNGFYRSLLNLTPSSNPFLTRSTGRFAFSFLNQHVVVPGSCSGPGNANLFAAIPILSPLNVLGEDFKLQNQDFTFNVVTNGTANNDIKDYSVVFINQQNTPVVAPIFNVQTNGNSVTFQAHFNAADLIADGLTIAAVTKNAGPFASADDVANAALYGPGLIEIAF